MKILVLIKKTPDTEAKIKIAGDQKSVDFSDTKFIINPYDEYAIEEALLIKAKQPAAEVVVASLCDESGKELIIKGLAMGADRGLLIKNDDVKYQDSLVCAKILAAAIKAENANLVLTGRHAIDDDNMHIPAMVAEILGWPQVNVVTKCTLNGDNATVERSIEGGQVEVYDLKLPAVIGTDKALNQPRYASLPGIMKAKKKPLDTKSAKDFGLDPANLNGGSKIEFVGFSYPPAKPAGKVFKEEDLEEVVGKVVKLLREEAKVI